MPSKYSRQEGDAAESGTVQLTTTTDSVEHWPEDGARGGGGKAGAATHRGPGKDVDFAKIPMDEALSILKACRAALEHYQANGRLYGTHAAQPTPHLSWTVLLQQQQQRAVAAFA